MNFDQLLNELEPIITAQATGIEGRNLILVVREMRLRYELFSRQRCAQTAPVIVELIRRLRQDMGRLQIVLSPSLAQTLNHFCDDFGALS